MRRLPTAEIIALLAALLLVGCAPDGLGPIPSSPVPGTSGPATEPPFTVAVIPDTQQETWSDDDTRGRERADWLVDNAERLNLTFVTHVGDIVDWGAVAPQQFVRAKAALAPLDGQIPYSVTIGNHDTAAVCGGGSACPDEDASITVRDTTAFNAAFPVTGFANVEGSFENGKVDNTYSTFTAGGLRWMVLNLELWPREAAIEWAKEVVAAHPSHNVIVVTHSYLEADGSIGTTNGGYGATSPLYLFDNLIRVFPNIALVLSGHTGEAASRVDTGIEGNRILSLLQGFHSRTTNPVRLITIDPGQGLIVASIYAPRTDETIVAETATDGFEFAR